MISAKKYFLFILLALYSFGWIACTQVRDPCLTPKTASLNINTQHLRLITDSAFVDTALPSAEFIPITINANDTIIFPQQANFTISLSPDSTICRWSFRTDTAVAANAGFDTLTFFYERKLQFISNACGFTYFYNIDSVQTTRHNVDSVHVLKTIVTNNVNTKQLQICVHTHF